MTPATRSAALAAATLLLTLAASELAWAQVEVSVYGAVYAPLSDLGTSDNRTIDASLPPTAWRVATSPAVGGRLTVWLSRRLGVEAAALFSPADLEIDALVPALPPAELDARVTIVSGRVVWRPVEPAGPVTYHVLGGLGLVTRSGTAFETVEGKTDPLGVAGGGLRARLGPRLDLRLDLEVYAYFTELTVVHGFTTRDIFVVQPAGSLGSHLVTDLAFSLGLALRP